MKVQSKVSKPEDHFTNKFKVSWIVFPKISQFLEQVLIEHANQKIAENLSYKLT